MMKIAFLQTGGTIDKNYRRDAHSHGYNFRISKPAVKFILHRLGPNFKYKVFTVCRKDSLNLNDDDRRAIFEKCLRIKHRRIIITHGTDTLRKTAKRLRKIKNKVIILTGAMLPARFSDSDATFNIGVAVGAINNLEDGVYISMGGVVYKWDDFMDFLG